MIQTKPWYLSRTIWASLVGILLSLGGLFGLSVEEVDGVGLTDSLVQAATAIAGVLALFGRLAATRKIG
jgi:hypothetical protein